MIYYKPIEIENFKIIQLKVKDYIYQTNWHTNEGFNVFDKYSLLQACPELESCLHNYGLLPVQFATYITHSQHMAQVHIDSSGNYDSLKCRINVPILNCEGSATEFYQGGVFQETQQIHAAGKRNVTFFKCTSTETLKKVDEIEIIKPTVIRIHIPHRVKINSLSIPRICLSIRTNRDPVFLLE